MKHIASNFAKLDKFEGVDFRKWQKKMHFLLSSMSVVYVLITSILEDGENATMEQIKKKNKFTQHKIIIDEAIQVSCIIDKLPPSWKNFKHTLKHRNEELTLLELGSHLRIEKSLKVQDSDKPKGNNVAGPSMDDDGSWWVDSGATVHVCQDRCWFKTYESLNDGSILHIGNESTALDEALDKFKVFKTKAELQQGSLIKRFRTDKGGEYMDTLYFQSVGIIHETAAPYTPQPNGISESKNKVLKEMFNSMLSYSGLSQGFWGETMFYVIEPNELVSMKSIFESMDAIFDENRFSSVPRPSLRVPNGTEDISGSVVLEEATEVVDLTKELLSSKFSMKDMGDGDVILGIKIKHESNGIAISQSHYIKKVISQLEYSRVIGCLMYVMTCTRPDIAFAVVFEEYTDASWISNTKGNSSTSGWVFLLGGGAISWASKKQTCITGSTIESEFVALAAAGKEAEWLKNLILEIPLWSKPIAPIFILCDSAATLAKAYSQMYNEKSRYLGCMEFGSYNIYELDMDTWLV
ncbi:zinc finger, CCHC-type containing protein [Tanacetum coccineum]